eukprot:TRINITY_DN1421_c0_g2_i1.p1 TRINITY_DN1421_c0_g2~~TRINITY_DN1421_c0_g2_i1.p1  ORF type:complete len:258 (-),score=59.71 TRINITY_DN1421_c0_g2_i1:483-1256(-)
MPSLVGSEMCIRDRYQRRVHGDKTILGTQQRERKTQQGSKKHEMNTKLNLLPLRTPANFFDDEPKTALFPKSLKNKLLFLEQKKRSDEEDSNISESTTASDFSPNPQPISVLSLGGLKSISQDQDNKYAVNLLSDDEDEIEITDEEKHMLAWFDAQGIVQTNPSQKRAEFFAKKKSSIMLKVAFKDHIEDNKEDECVEGKCLDRMSNSAILQRRRLPNTGIQIQHLSRSACLKQENQGRRLSPVYKQRRQINPVSTI